VSEISPARRPARGRHYLRVGERPILPVGAHFVPVEGPDWPWRVGPEAFDRAFGQMAAAGLDAVRIDLLWSAVEPEPGRYDEAHLAALDAVLAAARRHHLRLHPTLFIGGEVGDAYWDVPWRAGRHPHRDPELLGLQAAHAAHLARRWRGDPAILAWDLTDEPPFWLFRDTTDDDARAWTRALAGAIREADPEALVTIGTAGQDVGWGPFRADVVAGELDFATVHPYPIYAPELYPDTLLGPRMTHAAAFETALAAGAGRPVMVHEYGASSAQFEPERIAAYDRLLAWSSLGRGATGFFAWCWTDAEPAAFARAPYVRQPHETQFGVTDWTGTLRPRGRVLADLAATVRRLDLAGLASHGPVTTAAIPVPHEFAHPYDPAAYGLAAAPAGTYVPAETAWNPARDAGLLVGGLLNAFVLASRAGLATAFPRERLDGAWPVERLVLLPAPLASTSNTLHHLRTSTWAGLAAHLAGGGTAFVSCSADVAIAEMDELLGCRIVDRAPAATVPVLRFVQRWGPFAPGDELVLPTGDGTLHTRSVVLAAAAGSTVVAVDGRGEPALVVAGRGAGWVATLAHPLELLLARTPDAHGPGDRTWGIYAGLADVAGVGEPAAVAHPDVTTGSLRGPDGGLVTLTNHGPATARVELRLPENARSAATIGPEGAIDLDLEAGEGPVDLEPYGAAVVEWRAGR
jgi:hypothetical protein